MTPFSASAQRRIGVPIGRSWFLDPYGMQGLLGDLGGCRRNRGHRCLDALPTGHGAKSPALTKDGEIAHRVAASSRPLARCHDGARLFTEK